MKRVVVVRVRGRTGVPPKAKRTMELMRLTRANHCSIVDDSEASRGMLAACKDFVTWGEPSEAGLAKLIGKRGVLPGGRKLSEDALRKKGFASIEDFTRRFLAFEAELADVGIKPVFRLTPPRKGYRHIKRRFPHGALGYRGGAIDALIARMV